MWRTRIKFIKCEDNFFCHCPFFPSAGLGTEVAVRIARNSAAPQISTAFNTVPYSTEHTRNTTEVFLRNTVEIYSQSSSKRDLPSLHTAGTTDASWSPSTTAFFSSTTTEVKREGWYGCAPSQKALPLKRLALFQGPLCTEKSVTLCLNGKLCT